MTHSDPVLEALSALAVPELDPELSRRIRLAAVRALKPRPVHPLWTFAAAASVISYIGWALYFTSSFH